MIDVRQLTADITVTEQLVTDLLQTRRQSLASALARLEESALAVRGGIAEIDWLIERWTERKAAYLEEQRAARYSQAEKIQQEALERQALEEQSSEPDTPADTPEHTVFKRRKDKE